MCVYFMRDFNLLRCDSMSVHVSNLAIMSSGIGNNNNNNHYLLQQQQQQRMIIAKPTQHHYLLLVRLPAPALIQQRCCSFRQGKPLRRFLLRYVPGNVKKKKRLSNLADPGNRMKSASIYIYAREKREIECLIKLPSKGHKMLSGPC